MRQYITTLGTVGSYAHFNIITCCGAKHTSDFNSIQRSESRIYVLSFKNIATECWQHILCVNRFDGMRELLLN